MITAEERVGEKTTLDISKAFEKVGGFGRYQKMAFILFAIVRNFGCFPIYGFAYVSLIPEISVIHENIEYQCWSDYAKDWVKCNRQ